MISIQTNLDIDTKGHYSLSAKPNTGEGQWAVPKCFHMLMFILIYTLFVFYFMASIYHVRSYLFLVAGETTQKRLRLKAFGKAVG